MSVLKTDYVEDILDTSKNTQRKYRMITNDDGTVSFEDVTEYLTEGDAFGATDINSTNEEVNQINNDLKEIYKEMYIPNSHIYEVMNTTAFRNGNVTFNFPHELDLSKTQIKILSVMAKIGATGEWIPKNVGIWWIIKEITSTSITLYFSGGGIDANQFYRALVEVTEWKKPTE